MNVQKLMSGWWLRQIPRPPAENMNVSESHFLGTSNVLEICTLADLIYDLNYPFWERISHECAETNVRMVVEANSKTPSREHECFRKPFSWHQQCSGNLHFSRSDI